MFNNSSMLAAGDTADFTTPTPPAVNAGGPYAGDWNGNIALNATVTQNSGSDLVITWTSDKQGTFSNINIEDPIFTPTEDGTHILTITVTTSNTNAITDTASLTANPVAPIVDAGGTYSSVVTRGVALSGILTLGSDPLATVKWTANVAGTFSNSASLNSNFYPSEVGAYILTLTVTTNDAGNVQDQASGTSSSPISRMPTFQIGNTTPPPQSFISTNNNAEDVWQIADKNENTSFTFIGTGEIVNFNIYNGIEVNNFWIRSAQTISWKLEISANGSTGWFTALTTTTPANTWKIIITGTWSPLYNFYRLTQTSGAVTVKEFGAGFNQ